MREVYVDDYYVAPLVDFDKVTFGLLYENLLTLSNTTKLSYKRNAVELLAILHHH
jgi:hypothetical protein